MELADEFCLRHWSGKAAFAAAFRRPLFSVLQEVYATMDWAKQGTQVVLSGPVLDEILRMSILLPLAETDLTSPISMEISCTDASPSGGGCSVATACPFFFLSLWRIRGPAPTAERRWTSQRGARTAAQGSVG